LRGRGRAGSGLGGGYWEAGGGVGCRVTVLEGLGATLRQVDWVGTGAYAVLA
jgi:hypothetical protein